MKPLIQGCSFQTSHQVRTIEYLPNLPFIPLIGLVAINTTLLTYGALIVLGGGAIALLMYLLANAGANQRYANAYNQYGGYQGGNQHYNNHHYANRRMFDGEKERYVCKKEGNYGGSLTRQWFAYFNPASFQGPSPGSTLTSLVWSPRQLRFTRN